MKSNTQPNNDISVQEIFNKNYPAICYGGYRVNSRAIEPSISEIKEDLQILSKLGIKWIRTYNVHLAETENILKAITELKKENSSFEMYMMLGAWIDCKNAWTSLPPIHSEESDRNAVEIEEAIKLSNEYANIVKVLSVGNEAMVNWATSYYVLPEIILKWVLHLQKLKKENKLNPNVWITSSDNFASWGGDTHYQTETLIALAKAVDYISIHTYPMHDTHYNPIFWVINKENENKPIEHKLDLLAENALNYAKNQYNLVANYIKSINVHKPIHIGETGWATKDNNLYGANGSMACDEYKSALYYQKIMKWSQDSSINIFYFSAFDENWKDANNLNGSENHFGLFTIEGKAKFALWNLVDSGYFIGAGRNGQKITKTFEGNYSELMKTVIIKYN